MGPPLVLCVFHITAVILQRAILRGDSYLLHRSVVNYVFVHLHYSACTDTTLMTDAEKLLV